LKAGHPAALALHGYGSTKKTLEWTKRLKPSEFPKQRKNMQEEGFIDLILSESEII
jgi:hypothetical protein